MNKPLSVAEMAAIETAHPITEEKKPLTKREKIAMWADLVRKSAGGLYLYSNLEHWKSDYLNDPRFADRDQACNAMSLATSHEPFKADGLTGTSVADVMKYFDITQPELHAFSCDCGGTLSNEEQARRIERLV